MTRYNQETESKMKLFFNQLNEKDQRHYAAQEAIKLGYGGKKYIGELFNISQRRIKRGEEDLNNLSRYEEIPPNKQRRIGGGRKKKKKANQI